MARSSERSRRRSRRRAARSFRPSPSRGVAARLATLALDGQPVNHGVGPTGFLNSVISEVFLLSGRDLLQLTKFDRVDTFGLFVDPTRHRAFFAIRRPRGKQSDAELSTVLDRHVRRALAPGDAL